MSPPSVFLSELTDEELVQRLVDHGVPADVAREWMPWRGTTFGPDILARILDKEGTNVC